MRRAVGVVVLLFTLGFVAEATAQAVDRGKPSGEQEAGFRLEQNYPNPFNPETRIPFYLGEELFVDGKPVRVTIRIYNVLQQLVAIPTALRHSRGAEAVERLGYTESGRYEAYWDGTDRRGQQVASGVYFVQLTVNGRSQVRKMFVTK
ncbi:MAG: hypothetical protein HY704_02985 [Gemmatimonadetes bacterium]|nr:hypothetical protein [Gemmatimonadota bacterium]